MYRCSPTLTVRNVRRVRPAATARPKVQVEVESSLRELAYAYHLTERVKAMITQVKEPSPVAA